MNKFKHFFSLGDNDCFVFTLKPSMAVYHSTGINDHYMYLNIGMKTIPNGLVSINAQTQDACIFFIRGNTITIFILGYGWSV